MHDSRGIPSALCLNYFNRSKFDLLSTPVYMWVLLLPCIISCFTCWVKRKLPLQVRGPNKKCWPLHAWSRQQGEVLPAFTWSCVTWPRIWFLQNQSVILLNTEYSPERHDKRVRSKRHLLTEWLCGLWFKILPPDPPIIKMHLSFQPMEKKCDDHPRTSVLLNRPYIAADWEIVV